MAISRVIVLDSAPLGFILHKPGLPLAQTCRNWVISKENAGARFVVPEIVDYEIRRELLRTGKLTSVNALDAFINADADRLLRLNSSDLRLAAELWAKSRQAGRPTADPHALDIDIILCAQVTNANFGPSKPIVATSNISHLAQFVDARDWQTI